MLYTGNWYAALSVDGGRTFKFMDPATSFPDPSPAVRFCCDQVAQYVTALDMFVWLLAVIITPQPPLKAFALAELARNLRRISLSSN